MTGVKGSFRPVVQKLIVEAAETKTISYTCTGLAYDETTDIEQISKEFKELVAQEYIDAKKRWEY